MTSSLTVFCFFIISIKQIDSMLLWVFTITDHWRCENVVRTSAMHLAAPLVPFYIFVPILI